MLKRLLAPLLGAQQTTPMPGRRGFLLEMLPKRSIGAEIGVHQGDFSAEILSIVDPIELHLVDPWRYEASETYASALYGGRAPGGQPEMDERHGGVHRRFAADPRVHIHRASSNHALEKFPDRYFDWVYIDGNHLEAFVRRDLELALRKTKPGGYITGDDYGEGGWWDGGVKKAVDAFVREAAVRLVTIRDEQFVILR